MVYDAVAKGVEGAGAASGNNTKLVESEGILAGMKKTEPTLPAKEYAEKLPERLETSFPLGETQAYELPDGNRLITMTPMYGESRFVEPFLLTKDGHVINTKSGGVLDVDGPKMWKHTFDNGAVGEYTSNAMTYKYTDANGKVTQVQLEKPLHTGKYEP